MSTHVPETKIDLLTRKANQLHRIILILVAIVASIYCIANILMGHFLDSIITLIMIPVTGICMALYLNGKILASKIINALQINLALAFLCLVGGPETFITMFSIPSILGTLIVMQGKDRKMGLAISSLSIILMIFLITTNITIGHKPIYTQTTLRIERLLNMIGSSIVTIIMVNYILKVNNLIQDQLIERSSQLNESNELLKSSLFTKDKMISVISHDLKSPLILIKMWLEQILPSHSDEETKNRIVKQLTSKTASTLQMLDEMLEWANEQTASMKYKPEDIKMMEIADFIRSNNTLFHHTKGIHFELDIPETDQTLNADRQMLHSILRNLIANAYKFTPNQGKISIVAKNTGAAWKFSISDSGLGLDQPQIEALRKGMNFTKLGTNQEKGHGLGLQIVRDFLTFHRSRLEIDSQPGQGSVFSFELTNNGDRL